MAAETPVAGTRRTPIIIRVFQLWRVYSTLDLLWVTRSFQLCALYYLADLTLSLAGVTGVFLLAERFDGLGDWRKTQVVFMLGYATLIRGVVDTFFGFNVDFISRRLGRGQLDHTLIQPQPVWLTLLTEGFMPFSGSGALLVGIGIMLWSVRDAVAGVTTTWLALLLVNVVASAAVILAFSFLWGSLAFWAPRAAEEISSSAMRVMTQLKPFPLDGISGVMLGGLLTVVPTGLVAWYPCRALLGIDRAPGAVFVTPVAAVVIVGLAAWVFRRGLQYYGRTGSQRYLSYGHRR